MRAQRVVFSLFVPRSKSSGLPLHTDYLFSRYPAVQGLHVFREILFFSSFPGRHRARGWFLLVFSLAGLSFSASSTF